jgi:hypothetical protein
VEAKKSNQVAAGENGNIIATVKAVREEAIKAR